MVVSGFRWRQRSTSGFIPERCRWKPGRRRRPISAFRPPTTLCRLGCRHVNIETLNRATGHCMRHRCWMAGGRRECLPMVSSVSGTGSPSVQGASSHRGPVSLQARCRGSSRAACIAQKKQRAVMALCRNCAHCHCVPLHCGDQWFAGADMRAADSWPYAVRLCTVCRDVDVETESTLGG